jgi:hypothetical protein
VAVLAIGAVFAVGAGAGAAALGAAAGTVMTAVSLGFAVGSTLGSLLFPPDVPDVIGPRLQDLQIQTASYGTPIPLLYGVARLPGIVLWGLDIDERTNEEELGGKGGMLGGGGQTSTTYTYYGRLAVAFCAGPVDEIRQIWADGKLIYDGSVEPAVEKYPGELQIYLGTEDQLPNGLMEAAQGLGRVPAHRGICYIAVGGGHGFPLADFGNHYPTFTAEVCRHPESA